MNLSDLKVVRAIGGCFKAEQPGLRGGDRKAAGRVSIKRGRPSAVKERAGGHCQNGLISRMIR